jgi:transcriptional regulator with XRE-family HTH domain
MGSARPRPRRLAEKLLHIRKSLGFSQPYLFKRLGVAEMIHYTNISKYELDKNEPPLMILLAYAKLAQIHLEVIVDDDIDLPRKLPGTFDYQARLAQSSKP